MKDKLYYVAFYFSAIPILSLLYFTINNLPISSERFLITIFVSLIVFIFVLSIKNRKISSFLIRGLENTLDAKSENLDEYGIPIDKERDRAFSKYIETKPFLRKFFIIFSSLIILYSILLVISQIIIYFNMSVAIPKWLLLS